MHKSITTFVLLLSSLVMLAAMPFVNMNIVSNATAQGYNDAITIVIANTLLKIKNTSVRTGPFEGFFVSSVEFCEYTQIR